MNKSEVRALLGDENYVVELSSGSKVLVVDEPVSLGGQDKGMDPMELLAGALASCTAITLRMYAVRKGWDFGKVDVRVVLERDGSSSCVFHRHISIEKELEEAQRERLLQIADACPVHKVLKGKLEIRSSIEG